MHPLLFPTTESTNSNPLLILRGNCRQLDAATDGNAGHAEDVSDLAFLQARGVVFEGQLIEVFVDAETAQAVGIGELPQSTELLWAKRARQFVGDFDEGHAAIIATPSLWRRWTFSVGKCFTLRSDRAHISFGNSVTR